MKNSYYTISLLLFLLRRRPGWSQFLSSRGSLRYSCGPWRRKRGLVASRQCCLQASRQCTNKSAGCVPKTAATVSHQTLHVEILLRNHHKSKLWSKISFFREDWRSICALICECWNWLTHRDNAQCREPANWALRCFKFLLFDWCYHLLNSEFVKIC